MGELLPALSKGKLRLRGRKESPTPDDQQGRDGVEVGFIQLPMEEAGVRGLVGSIQGYQWQEGPTRMAGSGSRSYSIDETRHEMVRACGGGQHSQGLQEVDRVSKGVVTSYNLDSWCGCG